MFKNGKWIVTSGYTIFIAMFVWIPLMTRFDIKDINLIISSLILMLSCGFVTMINSSKHDELGQVFQIKKDFWLLGFIPYSKSTYDNLPVLYVLLVLNYFLAIILFLFVVIFRNNDWFWYVVIIGGLHGFEFIFSLFEVGLKSFVKR